VLDKAEYSAFQSTLNSPIVSYRIVEKMVLLRDESQDKYLRTLVIPKSHLVHCNRSSLLALHAQTQ